MKNESIKSFAKELIDSAPEYFWHVAASSTQKYHPAYALGEAGLCRHTKAACKIAHELLIQEMYDRYSDDEKDMIIVSLIAHDFFKHGLEDTAGKYTVAEHPLVCANFIRNNQKLCSMLGADQIDFICGCIASHMGMYNTDYRTKKEILPKPKTAAQKMVHQCDLLASRRWLNVDFEDDYFAGFEAIHDAEDGKQDEGFGTLLADIVNLCKTIIDDGKANRLDVYKTIADLNNGNRNPNSIKDVEAAEKIKTALEELMNV